MAGTERLVALAPAHLRGCLALSAAAKWNQNEADWRLMLGFGRGWGLELADGTLAASTLILPYGNFAWISMVLVLPEHRRKGYATRLLREALAELERRGLAAVLDATPAGRLVYLQEGFRDCWGFARYRLERPADALEAPAEIAVRALRATDWPQVLALDALAFGADRAPVLRALAARLPPAALLAERAGRIEGFLLGRDGRTARQLGPLVAASGEAATALLAHALAAVAPPLYLDLADREAKLRARLEAAGFAPERPFTRMVRGASAAPGEAARVMLVAGPELG
jgi:GNAT superfamily N-acetyltransferase